MSVMVSFPLDFRSVFEAVPGCYLILLPDPAFTIVAVSDSYAMATNTKRDEIVGKPLFAVFPDNPNDPHPTGVKNLTASLQTVLRAKKAHAMAIQKYDIPRPQGGDFEERYWSPMNSPVLNKDGEVLYIVHCVVDVTREMKLEQSFGGMEKEVREKTEELYQAKLFLNSIIEYIPDMIFVKDARELRFILFNRAGEKLLGVPRNELLGKSDLDFFPAEQAAFFIKTDRAVLEGRAPLDIPQEPLHSKTMGERVLHTKKVPMLNQRGEPEYLLGISEDITEHMRMETDLQNTKERLQMALESAQIGIWDLDIARKTTIRSLRHDQIFGYRDLQPTWTMDDFLRHVVQEDRADAEALIQRSIRTGSLQMQCRIRWPDGSMHWIEKAGRLYSDANRQPLRMLGIVMDITERKLLETRALEEADERVSREALNVRKFKQAVESATDSIIITAPDTTILYVNPAWQDLTGYAFAEVVGKRAGILKTAKTPENVHTALREAVRNGKAFHSDEFVNKRKDDTEYCADLTVYPVIEDGSGISFFVGIQKDVTEKKHLDTLKTEFISLVSHQLRTPLTALRLALTEIVNHASSTLGSELGELINGARAYATDMAITIDTMLSALNIEEGKVVLDNANIPLVRLSEKLKDSFMLECNRKHQHLRFECDPGLQAYADTRLLEQVLRTLLSNAIKYTPDGGIISLIICGKGGQVMFTVRDTGIGIPPGQQKKIFDKFFRAENAVRMRTDGTGLGLYIAHALVNLMGGTLRYVPPKFMAKGTTFEIMLPAARA